MDDNGTLAIETIRRRAAQELSALSSLASHVDDEGLRVLLGIAMGYVNDVEGPFLLGKLGRPGTLTEQEETNILIRAEAVLQLAAYHRETIQDGLRERPTPDLILATCK